MSTRSLLALGIFGPVLFLSVAFVEGAMRPGYDPVRQYVSQLSLGPDGWIQIVNFVINGALIAGFGVALRRTWASGPGARWTPRLVIAVGVALMISGVFVSDPALGYPAGAPAGLPTDISWHAGIHYTAALVVFLGLPAAIVVASRRAPMRAGAWRIYSVASAFAMFGLWLATFAFAGSPTAPAIAGLLQRIAVVAGFQWLAVTGLVELRRGVSASELAYA